MARAMILVVLALAAAPAAAQELVVRRTARLHVTVSAPDSLITLDGDPVVLVDGVLTVAPGQHTITAELRDGRYWARVVDLPAGDERDVTLGATLAPEAPALDLRVAPVREEPRAPLVDRYPRRRLSRTWGWLGVGVSAALAASLVYAAVHTMDLSTSYAEQPTRAKLDDGLAYRGVTEYALLPATATSLGLTVLAFVLSAPTATPD